MPHEKKGMHLFPWCTRMQNPLSHFPLTFGIHLRIMVGQSNPWWVCHTWPKEPFFTMLWTHVESFVCNANCLDLIIVSSCMSVYVSSACMFFFFDFLTNGEVLHSF